MAANTISIRGSSVFGLNDQMALKVPVAVIQDQQHVLTSALIDSGAQGNFIHEDLARNFYTDTLPSQVTVTNINGTENAAGTIRQITYLKILMDDHPFYIQAYVTNLGPTSLILGDPWLREVNPKIDWARRQITFTRRHLPRYHPAKDHL